MKFARFTAAAIGALVFIVSPIAQAAAPSYGTLNVQNALKELSGNAAAARGNLGLGNAAVMAVGMAPGNVASSSDSRIVSGDMRVIGNNVLIGLGQNAFGTASGGTTRVLYTSKGPLTKLQLFLPSRCASSGSEVACPNGVFYQATVEYPIGANFSPEFSLNGNPVMEVNGSAASGVLTDALGVTIPANTQFAIRYDVHVPWQPAATVASLVTGGTLTSGSTYYYKTTCTVNDIESQPGAETSATPTGATLAVRISTTAPLYGLPCTKINIYRGTTSGAEQYLTSIDSPQVTYIDLGYQPQIGTLTPPAAGSVQYETSSYMDSNMSTTSQQCGGTGLMSLAATGLAGVQGPVASPCLVTLPILLGDDNTAYPVDGMGDSIETGYNMAIGQIMNGNNPSFDNWFAGGLEDAGVPFINSSLASGFANNFIALTNATQRTRVMSFAPYLFSDLGSNDIFGSKTWQQLASYWLTIAQGRYQKGQRVYVTTIMPRVSTSDNMISLAGQTTYTAAEPNRVSYNTWLRNGMQVDGSGNPVLTGGTRTPYIAGYFDLAQAMGEVNSSGVPTINGGYWPVPSAPTVASETVGASSTTILVNSSVTLTAHAYAGTAIKFLTGSLAGDTAYVYDNTTTGLNIVATGPLPAAPSAGDTFAIYNTFSPDGTHPLLNMANIIRPIFSAWAAATFTGF